MSDNRLAEKIVGLPEFIITDVKRSESTMYYYVEKSEKPKVCPHCGVCNPNVRVHGSRMQDVRDIGYSKTHIGLMFKRKRYKCMECGQTFLELCDSIAPKARMTNRLRDYIAEQAKRKSFIELERELDISNVTVREIFLEEIKNLQSGQQIETPAFIGIDEIHITRKDTHRKVAWAVLCNGIDHTVMDILDNRNKSTIIEYLKGLKNPGNVQLVTMDMWKNYKDAVYATLPNAYVVVDKFHVVKMANEALDDYRLAMKAELGEKRNLKLKQERYLVLSRSNALNMTSQIFRDAWFGEFPEFKAVYESKEAFFNIFETDYSKKQAIKAYTDWKKSIPQGLTVFDELITSVDNWANEIFNYFDLRYNEKRVTNAFVEGANSAIRKIEAAGAGYDFEVLRAKVMMCVGHKLELPSYGSGTFSKMTLRSWNDDFDEPKDYGVPFDNIIQAINEGLL
jgi:transposase